MPTPPLPWLDKSLDGHALTVLVNGPHVVAYARTEAADGSPIFDLVHVLGGRTRSLVLLGEAELSDELDAIADGAREPVRE
ncbi:hypothetical protein SEA_HONK_57 [Microbacterium phage Honk]|uniref:Uncharacterized protein n=1 Tax=Microbacterium phage Honk TaxID=2836095 RepID=A0A8F3E5K6_9CAUD|nr:hypothetical protein SEA_HONK_57 [Microbacterium phage Honk]